MVSLARPARTPERRQKWMAASCSAMGRTALPCHCLAPPTWSVLDFVRTDLRTERLAIACGDRSDKALHPSQVAISRPSTSQKRETSELGRIIYKRAVGSNLAHPEEGRTSKLAGSKEAACHRHRRPQQQVPASQVVANSTIHRERKKSEQARKDHHMHAEGIKKGKECATPSGQTSVWAHQMRTAIGPPSIPG